MEGIEETYAFLDAPTPNLETLKKDVRAARGKAERRAAKQALRQAKQLLTEKDAAVYPTDELTKFEKPGMQMKLAFARMLADMDVQQLSQIDGSVLRSAQALPASEKAEKQRRRYAVSQAKKCLKMAGSIRKNYPNGIVIPDENKLHTALEMPAETKTEYRARKQAVRAAEKELELYHRTLKPYLDAKELVREYEISKTLLPDMQKRYRELTAQNAVGAQA